MIKTISLLKRRPGISHSEFREHYERTHVQLSLPYMAEAVAYERHYLAPYANPVDEAAEPTEDFDVITEISFENREDLEASMRRFAAPDAVKILGEDALLLFDNGATRMFIVDTSCRSVLTADHEINPESER